MVHGAALPRRCIKKIHLKHKTRQNSSQRVENIPPTLDADFALLIRKIIWISGLRHHHVMVVSDPPKSQYHSYPGNGRKLRIWPVPLNQNWWKNRNMNRQWRNLISCERGHGTSARKNWADGRMDRRTDIAIEIHYSDGQMDEQQPHNTVPTAPIGRHNR